MDHSLRDIKMKTIILFIRHGQTDWNLAHRWQGHTDIPLNDTGRAQAKALGSRLQSAPVSAIYSSDLLRAAQTAEELGEVLGLEPDFDPAWRERNGGAFEGLTIEELVSNHPKELNKLRNEGAAPPGGETRLELAVRLNNAFNEVVENHRGKTIAIVTHGGALTTLISYLLGFPLGERANIHVSGNTGLSIVEVDKNGTFLILLNDTSHLKDEMIRGIF
jgi:broad specificity phosphatase PhoE